jgi:hypothetical protein
LAEDIAIFDFGFARASTKMFLAYKNYSLVVSRQIQWLDDGAGLQT